MVMHTLLGYPYSVLRPEIDSWICTVRPDTAFSFTWMVTMIVRPPLFGSVSSLNAGVTGGVGGLGGVQMGSGDTPPSDCHVVAQSRRWSSPPVIRHWTHLLPGFLVTALVCV